MSVDAFNTQDKRSGRFVALMRKVESDGVKRKALKLKSKGSTHLALQYCWYSSGFFLPAVPTCTCTILAGR